MAEKNGYVYILDVGDTVKIGKSINPKTRMASIENEIGKKMLRYFASPDCSNYSDIEKAMHEIFSDHRIDGEWFNVDFDEVVVILKAHLFDNGICRPHEETMHINDPSVNGKRLSKIAEEIKMVMIKRGIRSWAGLARLLGMSPKKFYATLKEDNFREDELKKIAEVLGADSSTFTLNDTGEII